MIGLPIKFALNPFSSDATETTIFLSITSTVTQVAS